MSWLYLSRTLIVRFLQDKTKRSVTLKCKIWQLQDFFSRSINSLTILLSILFCGNMKKHVHKSVSQWNQRLCRWHDEPIYLTWFQDFIFSFFTIIEETHTIYTQVSNIFCIHMSIHEFNKLWSCEDKKDASVQQIRIGRKNKCVKKWSNWDIKTKTWADVDVPYVLLSDCNL